MVTLHHFNGKVLSHHTTFRRHQSKQEATEVFITITEYRNDILFISRFNKCACSETNKVEIMSLSLQERRMLMNFLTGKKIHRKCLEKCCFSFVLI